MLWTEGDGVNLHFRWHHTNQGGAEPYNRCDDGAASVNVWDLTPHGTQQFARVDNFRGNWTDDRGNAALKELIFGPGPSCAALQQRLIRMGNWMFKPGTKTKRENTAGNWMECLIGSCYHVATGGASLPPKHKFEVIPAWKRPAVCNVWRALQELGYRPLVPESQIFDDERVYEVV